MVFDDFRPVRSCMLLSFQTNTDLLPKMTLQLVQTHTTWGGAYVSKNVFGGQSTQDLQKV